MSRVTWNNVTLAELALHFTQRASRTATPSPLQAEVALLFAEWRPPLLRYLRHLGLPLADGEDLVQETFLLLFQHLQQDKPRDNLRGWTFRVAHNLALKRRQRDSRRVDLDLDVLHPVDGGLSPEEQAAMTGVRQRLRSVVEALPERDRTCLFLRAEGLRYREIALALDVSLGAVAASLSKSLGKLAAVYER